MTGTSRPAWHGSGPCVVGIDGLKLLLTASGMPRAWGGWRSVGKWGLVGWGLDALLYSVRRSCWAVARVWKHGRLSLLGSL